MTCKHCGIEEVKDFFVRTSHTDKCDGWILHDFVVRIHYREDKEVTNLIPTYKPCKVCRPGQYAVWAAGKLNVREWNKNDDEARLIYVNAERAAGNSGEIGPTGTGKRTRPERETTEDYR